MNWNDWGLGAVCALRCGVCMFSWYRWWIDMENGVSIHDLSVRFGRDNVFRISNVLYIIICKRKRPNVEWVKFWSGLFCSKAHIDTAINRIGFSLYRIDEIDKKSLFSTKNLCFWPHFFRYRNRAFSTHTDSTISKINSVHLESSLQNFHVGIRVWMV